MRNIINYATAIKNIVYVLTQEEVLLDTKVEIGDDYYASTTSNMTDSIIVVPNEYDILDEQNIFILNYINYKYGLELDNNNIWDHCLFSVLHEIGHIIDYSNKYKEGQDVLIAYSKEDTRKKNELHNKYGEELDSILAAEDKIRSKMNKLNDKMSQLLLEANKNLSSDNYNANRNTAILNKCNKYMKKYESLKENMKALNKSIGELDKKDYYSYRQITTEYEADRIAALILKEYGAQIRDYLTAVGL